MARQFRGEQGQEVAAQLLQRIKTLHPLEGALAVGEGVAGSGQGPQVEPAPDLPGLPIEGERLLLGESGGRRDSLRARVGGDAIRDEAAVRRGQAVRGGLRRRTAAEGDKDHAAHHQHHRRQGDLQHPGPPGDEPDALGHGPLAGGHGGGGAEEVRRGGAGDDHAHQRSPVVQTLALAQAADSPVVAGQLTVPAAEGRRPPHQGVVPVDRQAHIPQNSPQVVPVAVVGPFVDQDVAQMGLLHRSFIEVDGGPEHPEEAGGGQSPHQIYWQIARARLRRKRQALPFSAEVDIKFQVGQDHHGRGDPHSGIPGPAPEGHIPQGGVPAVVDDLGAGLRIHVGAVDGVLLTGALLPPLLIGSASGIFLIHGVEIIEAADKGRVHDDGGADCRVCSVFQLGPYPLRRTRYAHRRGEQGAGDQEPGRHQQPQGVLEAGVDPPPQQPPQQGDHQDQDGGSQDHLNHGWPPLLSPGWRSVRRYPPGSTPAHPPGCSP